MNSISEMIKINPGFINKCKIQMELSLYFKCNKQHYRLTGPNINIL